MLPGMGEAEGQVTRLLDAVAAGDPGAAERLLPLVYDELRRLARARLAGERRPGAAQPTSLVHEAYLRLVGDRSTPWRNRAYFFGAAGEAMRRILVDRARERRALKRGGDLDRETFDDDLASIETDPDVVLAIDQALARLEQRDRVMADVVKLRYFVGLTVPETADALDTSPRTVNRAWTAARAWLQRELKRA
jgi:RNA polymerase sigma factor (TIGR02999 family)